MQIEEKNQKYDRIRINGRSANTLDWLTDQLQGKMTKDNVKLLIFAKGIKDMPLTFRSTIEGNQEPIKRTIRFDTFIHPVMEGIIRQKNKKSLLTKEERRDLYERYFEFGAKILHADLKEKPSSNIGFWLFENNLSIVQESKKRETKVKGENSLINIKLGVDNKNNEVLINFNKASHAGFHIGLLGTTGSGKTQMALSIVSQICSQSPNTNILFFDYAKGDVATNKKLIEDINANVIDISKDGIPFNPFCLEEINDKKINELVSLLTSNQPNIGTNQSMELFDVLKQLYETYDVVDFLWFLKP